jgi:hypothetical protein
MELHLSQKTYLLDFTFILLISSLAFSNCSSKNSSANSETLTTQEEIVVEPEFLPDTVFSHTLVNLDYKITTYVDSAHVGKRLTENFYDPGKGVFMFRGDLKRDMPVSGKITGRPQKIDIEWVFTTDYNSTATKHGTWGGGLGWTGQPLLVLWPDSIKKSFKSLNPNFKSKQSTPEIIIGSLCGKVYFLDFDSGKETRPAINTNNPIKGTPSIDPRLNGMLYVGNGVPHTNDFGIHMIDLYKHEKVFFYSGLTDQAAYRRWGAFDSSPVTVGDFLYWPGENGILYKFSVNDGTVKLIAKMVYKVKGKPNYGIESSMSVYKNYGYFSDNHGNVFCVNLLNLEPVWLYDNIDDSDVAMVMEIEDGIPYVYTGCQVDKQPDDGFSFFTKINGLNGTKVWVNNVTAHAVRGQKRFNGGLFATPLLGRNNAKDLIITNFSQTQKRQNGELIAFYKSTGEIAYRTKLDTYSWSSPVGLYNENGDLFIFTGDVYGNAYIIDGSNGQIICKRKIGNNFEASPVVWGNNIIIGSRGREIYKLVIN